MIDKIKKIVKAECKKDTNIYGMNAYRHLSGVAKYSKQLAKQRKVDEEVTEIAAWLHDIGAIMGDPKNHHVVGAKYAGELLNKFNYPVDKIAMVKHCILSHRASKNIKRETVEAECLADADAMSHFDGIVQLLRLALISYKMDEVEAKAFVYGKLIRSWEKLTPEAKKIIKPKYEAVKELFE